MSYRLIYITAGNETEARKISQTLVSEKLVACVNYFPVKSVYRWQHNIEEAEELVLVAKTRAELVEKVFIRVKEIHTYQVPCLVSWVIEQGNTDYLDWISESTRQNGEE